MLSVCDPLCPAVPFPLCLSYTIYLFLWCNVTLPQEIHTQSRLTPGPLSVLSPWNNLQECIGLKNTYYSCLCDYYLLFHPAEPLSFHSAMFSPSQPSVLCQQQHNHLLVASSSSSLMIPVFAWLITHPYGPVFDYQGEVTKKTTAVLDAALIALFWGRWHHAGLPWLNSTSSHSLDLK